MCYQLMSYFCCALLHRWWPTSTLDCKFRPRLCGWTGASCCARCLLPLSGLPYFVWCLVNVCNAVGVCSSCLTFSFQDLEPLQQDVYQDWQSRADPSQQHHRVSGLKCTRSQPGCIGKYWIRQQRCLPLWKTIGHGHHFFCSPKSSHYHRIMPCYLVMIQ